MSNSFHSLRPSSSSPSMMDILSTSLKTHTTLNESQDPTDPQRPQHSAPSTPLVPTSHNEMRAIDQHTESLAQSNPRTKSPFRQERQRSQSPQPAMRQDSCSAPRPPLQSTGLPNLFIKPQELVELIPAFPLIVDTRNPLEYERLHVRGAINVNLPSLLIKRYRRGAISNFSLENFITSPKGTDQFQAWIVKHGTPLTENNADIQHIPPHAVIVVYDNHMDEEDSTASAWTLINVLSKSLDDANKDSGRQPQVYSLRGGFHGFLQWDVHGEHVATETAEEMHDTQGGSHATMPTPTQSRSACTFSSPTVPGVNVQRRASLFSLDTSGARRYLRSNGRGSGFRRRESAKSGQKNTDDAVLNSVDEHRSPTNPSSPHLQHPSSADATPATELEYSFIISEILPGFLYLGPELSSPDQVNALKEKSIRRILNMAEECDDDVPGLKQTFHYSKVAAQDTVEMKHVYETLHRAVNVIDDARRHHEPIYVHCRAGKSRSVAAILAYLLLIERWTLKRAYQHVIKARPSMSPNIGFVVELMKLEQSVHGQTSTFIGTDWKPNSPLNPPSPGFQEDVLDMQQIPENKSSPPA